MAAVAAAIETTPTGVVYLPVDQLVPAPDNPRKDLGDLSELAETIKTVGVLEPLVVVAENGHHTVLLGNRRLAAAKLAGVDVVPVIVRDDLDAAARTEVMLIENLQRTDLTPLEEARAFQKLVELGLSQRKLAERIGRSQSHISKRLALLELPAKVLKDVDSGGIAIADAVELARLTEWPERVTAALDTVKKYRWPIERAVREQLQEVELERKIAKQREAIEKAGLTLIEIRERGHELLFPSGVVEVDEWTYRGVAMKPAKHAKEPCHAAGVNPRTGERVYACTNPAAHKDALRGSRAETAARAADPETEKEKRRVERAKEKAAQLRAREKNLELGRTLAQKLAAPKIDAANMRLLADLLMIEIGSELAWRSFRYVDETSQSVVTKKDGSVARVVHAEGNGARKLLDDRLAAAKTPEQIMGILLQALVAAAYADTAAVPASQRQGHVAALHSTWMEGGYKRARTTVDRIAKGIGVGKKPKTRPRW